MKRTNKIASQVMKLAHSIKAQFATFSQALKAAWDKWHKFQTAEFKKSILGKWLLAYQLNEWDKKGERWYVKDGICVEAMEITGFGFSNAYFDIDKLNELVAQKAIAKWSDILVIKSIRDDSNGRSLDKKQEKIALREVVNNIVNILQQRSKK